MANKLKRKRKRKRKVSSFGLHPNGVVTTRQHFSGQAFTSQSSCCLILFLLIRPGKCSVQSSNRVVRTTTVAQTTSPSPKQLGLPPAPIFFFSPTFLHPFLIYKSFNKRKKYKFFAGRNFYVGFAYKSFVSKNFYIGFALYFRANDGYVDIPYIL